MGEASGNKVPRSSTFSRGRGNVFLVERGTRLVLWSHFLRPRTTRPEDMDRVADQIAGKLTSEAKQIAKERGKREKVVDVAPAAPVAPPTPVEESKPIPAAPPAAPAPQPPAPAKTEPAKAP
jgi:hypothetical protein